MSNENSQVVNFPRDTTMQKLVQVQNSQMAGATDVQYKEKVAAATSKAEVDALFAEWWKYQYIPELYSKSDMLERWFGNVLEDSRVHGVTTPRYAKSTSMIGELTDDSTGLVCTPQKHQPDPILLHTFRSSGVLRLQQRKKQMVPMRSTMWSTSTVQEMYDPVNISAGYCRKTPGRENGRMQTTNI